MKKIREAYKFGIEGKPKPENPSRAQRFAHTLGQRSLAKTVAINGEFNKQIQGRLHEAVSQSVGVNKKALELIELAAKIPNQASSKPDNGHEMRQENGERTHEWVTALSSGVDQDASRSFKTPLAGSLGSLHIDSTEWSHNGFVLPVDNVVVACRAPIDASGNLQAASTEININTRPYDPDNIVLDDDAEFKGGIKIIISPDGHITEFGMTRSSSTGYVAEDPSKIQIDLDSFFNNAQQATAETVSAYKSISDSPS